MKLPHSPRQPSRLALLALLGGLTLHAQAALFEDDEARRAILDLRAKQAATDEALKRAAETSTQQARSLVELQSQIEQLRGELAKLRGQQEQTSRDAAELQRKQKDIAQGVDERMRKLEPQQVTVDGKSFAAELDEKKQYDAALALLRGGNFGGAADALTAFGKRWPNSGYLDSTRFWLGNALYGKRDYKGSLAAFREFLAAAPQNPRAPEALLAIANTQVELKDTKAARATLNELIAKYPQAEAAVAGRERLAALK